MIIPSLSTLVKASEIGPTWFLKKFIGQVSPFKFIPTTTILLDLLDTLYEKVIFLYTPLFQFFLSLFMNKVHQLILDKESRSSWEEFLNLIEVAFILKDR